MYTIIIRDGKNRFLNLNFPLKYYTEASRVKTRDNILYVKNIYKITYLIQTSNH